MRDITPLQVNTGGAPPTDDNIMFQAMSFLLSTQTDEPLTLVYHNGYVQNFPLAPPESRMIERMPFDLPTVIRLPKIELLPGIMKIFKKTIPPDKDDSTPS